jgi:hypothetical protein
MRSHVLCAPALLVLFTQKTGALRTPRPSQHRCFLFTPQTFLQARTQRRKYFHWAKLHPTELHCILLSYAAPSWARCTLMSYTAPYWATLYFLGMLHSLHPELSCILSYIAPFWATLHPIWAKLCPKSYAALFELSCAHLSYAASYWAMPHPNWATRHPKKYYVPCPRD